MHTSRKPVFFMTLLALCWQPLITHDADAAEQWQSHAAIRGTAHTFLMAFAEDQHEGRSEIKLGQLDPRLKLKTCNRALQAFMPPGGRVTGNTTIGVRCDDETGWNIYIPARIDVFGRVLIARQPLSRGSILQDTDVELVERNLANLPYGYYTDSQPLSGMLAKRTIAAATVITPGMVQAPNLIKRGERVTVIAETGSLKIRTVGKALSDGKSGDLIRVESEASKRVVDGIVVSRGVVKVTL